MSLSSGSGTPELEKMSGEEPSGDVLLQTKYPEPYPEDSEARQELKERELEEARARAAQMEKTMRWWSDCTANWREKWGKVRAERNKAREDNRQLKLKIEAQAKDIVTLKRERQEALEVNARLERDIDKLERELKRGKRVLPSARVEPSLKSDGTQESVYDRTVPRTGAEQQFIDQILEKNDLYERERLSPRGERLSPRESGKSLNNNDEFSQDNIKELKMLYLKLEETQRLLTEEKSSKSNLLEEIECLQSDLMAAKLKNEELMANRTGTQEQLTKLRSQFDQEVKSLSADLEDAYDSPVISKQVKGLRAEIERLQIENSQEWGKREKLESEKLSLERENKKLKHQIEDLESLLSHKTARATKLLDTDMKEIQKKLDEKNAELVEMRHAYNKLKKQLQEKTADLDHSQKRVEQHDAEVKKLRARVEELKQELAKAEDETDVQANKVRKIQRSLDEQTERADSLQVQVEHLTSRLRTTSVSGPPVKKFGRGKASRSISLQLPLSSDSDENY
ncbi:coiled-coil domain-containing protein 102A [Nematostella vectensis]|uniref:coiled-coil domain-containing protein 102A n=1 Tax=Nematostella vectensis TaxID=45351 RepID=UPI00138FBC8D|nr:coiled-coil domain-containing protein 102A [Nematostella vectensis]